MLVETLVFGGQDRLFHDLRNFVDGDDGTPLLAEFADQHPIRGVYAQRHFGPIVGKHIERGQIGIGKQDHQAQDRSRNNAQPCQQQQGKGDEA